MRTREALDWTMIVLLLMGLILWGHASKELKECADREACCAAQYCY